MTRLDAAWQRARELETEQAGTLNYGDEFKFQPGGFGTTWEVFTFRGHVTTDAGEEWVDAFGGTPVAADYKHYRHWRAFPVDLIRAQAQPPGDLASGGGRRAA